MYSKVQFLYHMLCQFLRIVFSKVCFYVVLYPVHKKSMSKTANRNYLLVDAGINYQIGCLQIPGRYINVRDLCSSPPSRQSRKYD